LRVDVIRGRYFALVDRNDGAVNRRNESSDEDEKRYKRHERRQTPQPLMTRPSTIVQKQTVNVWKMPPMLKTTAPTKSVPLRPMVLPILPATIEVTAGYRLSRWAVRR
jgi:hypothetical protein